MKESGKIAFLKKEQDNNPEKPLPEAARKVLIKSIIEWTVRNVVWISVKDFPKLFKNIKELFPNEGIDLYFIQKCPGNYGYSGALFNAFRTRHKILRKETGIRKNNAIAKKTVAEPLKLSSIDIPRDVEVIRQGLISRYEPWDNILEDWRKTFDFRRREIKDLPLAKVLLRWPKFNSSRGYEMVTFNLFNSLNI